MFTGKVVDSLTGNPISYASVEITDKNGVYLGFGASADVNGNFVIMTGFTVPGSFARISSIGYKTKSYSFDEYANRKVFSLDSVANELPGIVISAQTSETEKLRNYALIAIAGIIGYSILKK